MCCMFSLNNKINTKQQLRKDLIIAMSIYLGKHMERAAERAGLPPRARRAATLT